MIVSSRGWIKKKPALTIVPMSGWYRSMYWQDTGLIWIPPSPHIPTADTSLDYVATGFLGEAGGISHGIGYTLPFKLVGHPSFNSFTIADEFAALNIPGVLVRPSTFEPFYGEFKNQVVHGVEIFYTDRDRVNLCDFAVKILYLMYHKHGIHMFRESNNGDSGPDAFDKICGGDALRNALINGENPEEIIASWQAGLDQFMAERRKYLLYGERHD
jgi:uncharacterized protein YbbC (DUF1343 family)